MALSMAAKVLCLLSVVTIAHAAMYGWGKNDQAQLGLGHSNSVFLPTSIPFYSNITPFDVLCAPNYHIALANNGSAYASGLQYYGQFAVGYSNNSAIRTPIPCPALNNSLDISLSGTACNANMNTNLLGWGNVAGYVQGKTTGTFPRIQAALPSYGFDGKVLSVNSVMEGVLVRLANNTVWAAGTNGNGRLGLGHQASIYTFVEATFWKTVPLRQIFSSQSQHVCAIAVNGSLYCWGQNKDGQLGVGDVAQRSTPTRVQYFDDGAFEIYKVVYGDAFTMVLTCGGRLFAFGSNSYGQMGQGIPDDNPHPIPKEVSVNNGNGNYTIVEVVSGFYQTMIRTSDNSWYVWGGGTSGSLGMKVGKDLYQPTYNPNFSGLQINRIRGSSQSYNFFGWYDPLITNDRVGCPVLQNECLNGMSECSDNAYCTDLERGYSCTCRPGWVGDGNTTGVGCANMNSCDAVRNLCVPEATCDDSSGIAACMCPLGSSGDGRINGSGCPDVDECQGNPCAANANCTNLSPDYVCSCNPGYTGDPVFVGCTILCQPGQYATNLTNCDLCSPGTYTDVTGAPNCFPCPGGTYNNEWGSDSRDDCRKCPTGGYSEPKATYCGLCVHGYTNDPDLTHTDNTTCYGCPLGTYGYYGQCYPCTQGKFSIEAVAKQCRNCPPGFVNVFNASLTCAACPAGTSSRGGSTTCASCPAGYYSPEASKDCLKCPLGTSTNGLTGQSSCTNCLAGFYNNKVASQNCFSCAAGTFSNSSGAVNCKRCAPGTIAASPNATSCSMCPHGTYASGSGSTRCSQCDPNSVTIDGISCKPCTAGYYLDSATRACKPCAPGTFVTVTGSSACFACSPGTYAAESASTYCKRCDVNTYSSATTGFVNCTACPPGTKSPGGAYSCS